MNVYLGELYKEVEYIQSDGISCCIDTGISPKDSTYLGLDFKIRPTALKANNNYFYSAGANPRCSFEYKDGNGYWNTGSSTKQGGHSMSVNNDYTYSIRYSNGSFSCSGAYNGSFNYSGTTLGTGNLVFFCFATDLTAQSAERLYSLKIYQGSSFVLVRDFVPCYRVSDNVIGLFDKVENKFYTNAGTGSFTKGNDVKVFQPELKNAYIGEVYEYSYDFTTGTHGWTPDSSAGLQNSNGIYANGLLTNVFWSAPSEIFSGTPKRIVINYNKTGTDSGIGIYTANPESWYFLPRGKRSDSMQNRFDWKVNGTITQNTINNPTGLCTWELDIDTSTTNWTITHKITGVSNITDNSGAFKAIWNSGALSLRTVNWDSGNPGIYIKSITFEY